ncbi:MAG TPA: PepSY-associated TM helix domain-containing protein [Bryobacteraceae bacterium]|nr:PepSY-associated TM helix domain-containing protein [Bryobacteraceae bacterium]
MKLWERWLRRPKSVWLRKALFQIHLWTGVALGLYVLMISVTGSAIVFRNELYTSLWPGPKTVAISGPRLTNAQLREAARRAYPRYSLSWIWDAKQPDQAIEIWLNRNGHRKERLFNPYTGEDLGESHPYSIQVLAWVADLHINLLAGPRGRVVNGVGAMFVVLLAITGAVLWWPGVRAWRRALVIRRGSNWKRFNWELHSVIGFWMLPLMLMFGVVGIYAGFPRPFQVLVNKIAPLDVYRLLPEASIAPARDFVLVDDPANSPLERPRFARPKLSTGDKVIRWFSYLHFGNFGGWLSKAIWVVLGLAPAFLFVTGMLMWWNRVLSPGARRARLGPGFGQSLGPKVSR